MATVFRVACNEYVTDDYKTWEDAVRVARSIEAKQVCSGQHFIDEYKDGAKVATWSLPEEN